MDLVEQMHEGSFLIVGGPQVSRHAGLHGLGAWIFSRAPAGINILSLASVWVD